MVKKLSKFTNFGIEKPTRKESDSTQRASGRKESGSSIKVKINPNETKRRKASKSKEKIQIDCNKMVKNSTISGQKNIFNLNFMNNNLDNLKSTSDFLKKQERDPSTVTSNHLYQFNSQVANQNEMEKLKDQQINLPVQNIQEIFIEGK